MNKRLLRAVVSAALMAGPAVVWAAPTVYGLIDVGLQHVDAGAGQTGSKMRMQKDQASGTRLGVTGSDDLGGGMKAIYTAEMGMASDTGTGNTNLFDRQIFAGLSTGIGTLTLGRQYTAENSALGLGQYGKGGTFESTQTGGQTSISHDKTIRASNYVKYVSPSFAGLTVNVGRGLGESTTGNIEADAGDYTDASLVGAWGPVKVGVAKSLTNRTSLATFNEKDFTVAGNVKFSIVTLYATVSTSEAWGQGSNEKFDNKSLGVAIKLGPGSLVVQANEVKDKKTANNDTSVLGAAYYWGLTKATTLYASVGAADNDSAATRNLSNAGTAAPAAGEDPKGYNVGLRVSF